MAEILGSAACHAIITPTCRVNRTDAGAFDEAISRLRAEYDACLPGNPAANFHLVLTVARPPVNALALLDARIAASLDGGS